VEDLLFYSTRIIKLECFITTNASIILCNVLLYDIGIRAMFFELLTRQPIAFRDSELGGIYVCMWVRLCVCIYIYIYI